MNLIKKEFTYKMSFESNDEKVKITDNEAYLVFFSCFFTIVFVFGIATNVFIPYLSEHNIYSIETIKKIENVMGISSVIIGSFIYILGGCIIKKIKNIQHKESKK
jgi:hypothetical protein